ncbi:SDR family NAD(P)-dependent oxidoreductase, partial [Diaphorobacter sp.]|uniref:SDR family NAD(P)-dependent oxidoreductase n=1 Tax=Diaphorobacter sp. TaxID=1934310 RepID=UPI00338D9DB6
MIVFVTGASAGCGAAIAHGAGAQVGHVRAAAGLGDGQRDDLVAGDDAGHHALLQLGRTAAPHGGQADVERAQAGDQATRGAAHQLFADGHLEEDVFFTGAAPGFGAALPRRLVLGGPGGVPTARRKDRLDALAAELGDALLPIELDVRDADAVAAVPGALPAGFAEVDVLVNNAGLALGLEPAHRASLDDWHTMIDTNCTGLVQVTRAFLPGMVARNRGHIFNLGSVAGRWPYAGGNVYGATKAFVRQFSLNLRADLLGTALRV